jgi:hypothetical protein
MRITLLSLVVVFLLPLYFMLGQNRLDVIHLKNGDVLKGTIIENVFDDHVRIELEGGSIFTVKYSEILKFSKEIISSPKQIAPEQSSTTSSLPPLNDEQRIYYENNKKSSGIAVALSILLTSSGHAYAGNWARGLIFTAVRAGGVVLALTAGFDKKWVDHEYYYYDAYRDDYYTSYYSEPVTEMTPWFYIGMGVSVVAMIWEAIDASSQVDVYNENLQRDLLGGKPYSIYIVPSKNGARLKFCYAF